MKEVTLPVGCEFMAGLIGPDDFDVPDDEAPRPPHGLIIWYEDAETMRRAMAAMIKALQS